jgi:hypothetical protein
MLHVQRMQANASQIHCQQHHRHIHAGVLTARAVSRCKPPAAAASQDASAASAAASGYTALCNSIRAEGGFVHPALQQNPSTGGIVAAQDIPQLKGSLVELPLSMRLTGVAAQELLLDTINAAGLPTM